MVRINILCTVWERGTRRPRCLGRGGGGAGEGRREGYELEEEAATSSVPILSGPTFIRTT